MVLTWNWLDCWEEHLLLCVGSCYHFCIYDFIIQNSLCQVDILTDFEKKCECGHTGIEHLLKEEKITIFALIVPFVRTIQIGKGICKKCTCPKFHQPNMFHSKRKIEYTLRMKNHEYSEQRCRKCGRLLLNHEEANHPFQEGTLTI